MITAISQAATVPVQEDLTLPVTTLNILRGLETMHRVDVPFAPGANFNEGDFGVLNSSGQLVAPGSTPSISTYLVFAGNNRFDAAATGNCTIVQASPLLVQTSDYDTGASYSVGSLLSVKSRGVAAQNVSLALSGEFCVGKVVSVGSGTLSYELFASPFKAP